MLPPRLPLPSIPNKAAYSWPICSPPGSTANPREKPPWRLSMMNPKITEHHRNRSAYVYLRQSTPGQVLHHQESTERQYALREKAQELGWSGGAAGFQDLGGRCLDGTSGRCVGLGSLPTFALGPRLASTAGVMCPHPNPGDRRGWLLRSGRFQRRTFARLEGDDGSGRAPFFAHAPPGR
jgi:hypothetical protein